MLDLDAFRVFTKKSWTGKPNLPHTSYINLWVGHDLPIEEIRSDMRSWLDTSKHGTYQEMLQAEDSVDIGWLLYSTQAIDHGALADEIIERIGINIGLHWKQIETGSKNKVEASTKQSKGLVVEVSKTQKVSAMRELHQLLGSAARDPQHYPNNIRLHFVK